ncbi:MAG: flagellar hook assembly protein FlgD [Proteobacteria bacterium]|nr:MAG: flagellar hook assembly protein FlgD [Pseudomonadota bacterium]
MTTAIESDIFSALGLGAAQAQPTKANDQLLQEDFLKLMVAQLKNQDPMKPMESGEFLGDIAQFGTVSGIQDLQESFASLNSSVQSSQALQAAALVDRQVLVPMSRGQLESGGAISGAVELPASTSQLTLGVYDSAGALVRQISMGSQPAGLAQFQWDGLADNGTYAQPGLYQVRAETFYNGESTSATTLIEADVRSVTLGSGGRGLTVDLGVLGSVSLAQVRQIL